MTEPKKPCEVSWSTMPQEDLVKERDEMRDLMEHMCLCYNRVARTTAPARTKALQVMGETIERWERQIVLISTYIRTEG